MKNKILTSVIITVLFALLIVASSFITIINLEQIKNTKEQLRNINLLVSELNDVTDISRNDYEELKALNNTKINGIEVRFTLINDNGVVLYDNEQKSSENHRDREEVKKAMETGEGYSKRYSETIKSDLIYCATRLSNNFVIRSSVSINSVTIILKENIKYCFGILLVVMPFSLFLSLRLVKKIVDPVKELESVTLKMTHGDYKIRANINTNDELGTLGNSFNNMAEQLQIKIREVIDNQNKIESILKSMESGVIAVDNCNMVISINPCAESLLGIKKIL
ncbi:methyl-accepting chemotaxis protein [Clostridium beijerinckii]|nr:methyl-accepting chemotaxis protein [Clostridium beijerinckii]